MKMDPNRYCDTCLFFMEGVRHDSGLCRLTPDAEVELRADRGLFAKSYALRNGAIEYIENDDPDNFQSVRVSSWPMPGVEESSAEALRLLQAHRFPTSDLIDCLQCHENPVEFLGDRCYDCSTENALWDEAERKGANAL